MLGLPTPCTGSAQSSHGSEWAEKAADIWTSWAVAWEGVQSRREGGCSLKDAARQLIKVLKDFKGR